MTLLAFGAPGPSLDSARRVVAQMKQQAPNSAHTLFAAAQLALFTEDPAGQTAAWDRALAVAPDHPTILTQAGFGRLWATADPESALPLMERAIKLAPRNAEIVMQAGFASLAFKKYDDAHALATRLAAIDPTNVFAYDMEVGIRAVRGDSVGVLEAYRTLIAKHGRPTAPALTNLLVGTREALQVLANTDLATVDISIAGFDSINVLSAKATALAALGDATAARRTALQARELADRPRTTNNFLFRLYLAAAKSGAMSVAGDRKATESALADLQHETSRFPAGSGAGMVNDCVRASAFANLSDTTAMYPALENCMRSPASGAIGYSREALQRNPRFAPFRAQEHFKRIVGGDAVKRSGG